MTVFFSADLHIDHKAIIEYCSRPFGSVPEMNEVIISGWNDCVKPGDVTYLLGDFALGITTERTNAILKQLNGQVHLIVGNHDRKSVRRASGFAWVGDQKYIRVGVEGQRIMLSHYAMRVWRGGHHGSWMLYGHSHGTLAGDEKFGKTMDVGVDHNDYRPVSFEEVKAKMEKIPILVGDYHKELIGEEDEG